jgi:transposase
MMGDRQVQQDALFYEFSLERHVPEKHLLRAINRFVDLKGVRAHLAPFYSDAGRPSIDPELLIRMLIVGYCFGIRSERRLCEEVHLNLAYRWFCRLGLDGSVPDHSTFSKNRHGPSARAICCGGCSRPYYSAASMPVWWAAKVLPWMPV